MLYIFNRGLGKEGRGGGQGKVKNKILSTASFSLIHRLLIYKPNCLRVAFRRRNIFFTHIALKPQRNNLYIVRSMIETDFWKCFGMIYALESRKWKF